VSKVLVTGASGFIGRHCVNILADLGHEVHGVTSSAQEPHAAVKWHRVSLFDTNAVSDLLSSLRPSYLLHLAWYTTPGSYWTSAANVSWVKASLSLIEAFVESGGRRLAVAGTCAEYDWTYGYCSESLTPTRPSELYGECKHSLRLITERYCSDRDVGVGWGRLFFIYGPHEPRERLVSSTVRALLAGTVASCKNPRTLRDYLYVQDAASALIALLLCDFNGPVNIASGQLVAIGEIVRMLGRSVGREDLVELAPQTLTEGQDLLFGNVSRLTETIGWSPAYSLDRGLQETVNWWTRFYG
jgi:nucleoside-diphosphate-sugar epimerase